MSTLGTVEAESVERLCMDFVDRMSATGSLIGSYESTERLLQKALPRDGSRRSWRRSAAPPAARCGTSWAT